MLLNGQKAMVLRLKKDPEFAISETANYALLNCLIEVLDIAIDAGFSKHPSHSSNSSQTQIRGIIREGCHLDDS